MSENQEINPNPNILIWLQPLELRGSKTVALNIENVIELSSKALDEALDTIREVAIKVHQTTQTIPISHRPDELDVSFGLQLTTNGTAFVVSAGVQAQFTVTMKWTKVAD